MTHAAATVLPRPGRRAPPIGALYDVVGLRLALHRSGDGGPAVVFLPGAGLVGLDFLNVHQKVARFTTSVIYDRAGTGWSDPVRLPRTAADVAKELRDLLGAARVAPPYLLVSHSLGGAYARRYAQLYPDETAGLVFLDPAHEGYLSEPKREFGEQARLALTALPKLLNARKFYGPMFQKMFAAWPDGLRQVVVDYHLSAWSKTLAETKNLQSEVLKEIAGGGPLPDIPLIILTAMGIDPFMAPFMSSDALRASNVRKAGYYDSLASSAPLGENWLIDGAGHSTLHTDRPDLVVAAVRRVADIARTRT